MRLARGSLAAAALAWSLVVGNPAAVMAQQVPEALRYIPAEAFAAATAQPAALMQAEAVQVLPLEVFQAGLVRELSIDPAKVSRVTAFFTGPIRPPHPPGFGLVIDFTEPVDATKILPMFQQAPPAVAGNPQLQAMWPKIEPVEGNRVLLAPEAILKQMKAAAAAQPGSVPTRLASLAKNHMALVLESAPVREDITRLLSSLPELPPPFGEVRNLPSLVEVAEASVEVTETFAGTLQVQGVDGPATDKLQALVKAGLQMMRASFIAEGQRAFRNDDPIDQAMGRYLVRMADRMIATLTPERNENALVWKANQGVPMVTTGILTAMLLPAVQAARESARTMNSQSNLKQICIACLHYADRHNGKLPPRYSVDSQGKPLLSWRVHVLPYLEQGELYRQFKLDEPWDSPHNRKLIERMPEVYQSPNLGLPGQTVYQVLVGPGTLYQQRTPPTLDEVSEAAGTSRTVLAVETDADRAVVWTKPDDLPMPAADQVPAGLGGLRANNLFLALFCDGSVMRLSTADPNVPEVLAPFRRAAND